MHADLLICFAAGAVLGGWGAFFWMSHRQKAAGVSSSLGEWAVVELMGHVRFGAHVRWERVGGGDVIRCEIPGLTDERGRVQRIRAASLYRMTRCDQDTATRVAAEVIERWGRFGDKVLPWEKPDRTRAEQPPLPFGDHHEVGVDYCSDCDRPVDRCTCDDDQPF